jgi:hypothetical protein
MKNILTSPITHFNLLVVGSFIAIQLVHMNAHRSIEVDVDSYVRDYCRKNEETCQNYLRQY